MAVVLSWAPHAQVLPFVHYTPESDLRALPSAEVHGVEQDQLGYLWASVYSSGVVRYDGVRMDVYDRDDGLRDLAVWETMEDADGHLWIASNGGLTVSERPLDAYGPNERVRFTTTLGGVDLLNVGVQYNRMAVDATGRVWVGTSSLGIVRYTRAARGARADTLAVATDDRSVSAQALLTHSDGSVWAGLGDGRILRYADGRPRLVATTGPASESPSVLFEEPGGRVLVGTRNGAVVRVTAAGAVTPVVAPLGGVAVSILRTQAGETFVATSGAGLLVLDRGTPRVLTRQNGLLSLSIHDLTEDAEGSVWVAQSGGLSKLRPGYRAVTGYTSASVVGERPALPATAVGAVAPGVAPCAVWAGTPEGVACLSDDFPVESSHLGVGGGLSGSNVNALLPDAQGRVWIGTLAGIDVLTRPGDRVPGGRFVRRVVLNGASFDLSTLGGSSVLGAGAFPIDGEESLWFAAFRRLYGLVGDDWVQLGEAAGLPETVFHAITADDAGHLWIGTRDQGLYRSRQPVTPAALRRWAAPPQSPLAGADSVALFAPVWTTETGAPTDEIEALVWADGALWVATQDGLHVLAPDGRGVRSLDVLGEAELGSSSVFSLAAGPGGTLWAGTNAGLAEVAVADRAVRRTYRRRDGLVGEEVWYHGSVALDDAGRVLFGTARGLAVVDPSRTVDGAAAPRLRLREALVTRQPSGYTEASFEVAPLSFVDEGALRYRYRLLGYEDEWSAPTTDAFRRYTSLASVLVSREYVLEAQAGTDGAWTAAPTRYAFRVGPPWWLGPWVFLGSALALVGAVMWGGRVHRRRVVKRELERARVREAELRARQADAEREATEARAQALRAEADRQALELEKARELSEAFEALERSHQELQEAQTQLVQQEKMASLGRVTSGVAHELKNPLNFINNFSRLSVELSDEIAEITRGEGDPEELADLLDDLRENAVRIEGHGRRADEIVRTMLLLSQGSSGPRQRVKVDAVVRDSIAVAEQNRRAADPDAEVEVTLDLGTDDAFVEVSPVEIGRVMLNLFDNAFYYAARSAALGRPGAVRVATRRVGDAVRVEVSDSGAGVPEANRGNVFEPFFTTKPTGTGTGLGLSLSFDIVAQHGGTLALDDTPTGAQFSVTLPTIAAPADAPAAVASESAS